MRVEEMHVQAESSNSGGKRSVMNMSLLTVLSLTVAVAGVLIWRSGITGVSAGSRSGLTLFLTMLPQLLVASVLAGMVQVLVPREVVARWMSDASGMRAMVVATIAGALTPGGPFVQFPVVAAIYGMGAGPGAIVAYLTAWSLMGLHRTILYEIPFLGPRLALTRILVSLPLPVIAGSATRWMLRLLSS